MTQPGTNANGTEGYPASGKTAHQTIEKMAVAGQSDLAKAARADHQPVQLKGFGQDPNGVPVLIKPPAPETKPEVRSGKKSEKQPGGRPDKGNGQKAGKKPENGADGKPAGKPAGKPDGKAVPSSASGKVGPESIPTIHEAAKIVFGTGNAFDSHPVGQVYDHHPAATNHGHGGHVDGAKAAVHADAHSTFGLDAHVGGHH